MDELKLGDLIVVWDTEYEDTEPTKKIMRFARWYANGEGVVCFKEGVKTSAKLDNFYVDRFDNWEFL